ncbi:phosphatidylinositol-glycan biosynthesis class X protein [Lutzomyia longipalpis]|uniref:phosphatidylinositol-glycan biosynthesis class X protein n=1 Tax=Lutzomyia longipalpis TaxID=7200 RepID=UPI002483F025|nr:phosphatidylinositol-glycan biosynthesis class X protein [Lutzomyia longipalpis]
MITFTLLTILAFLLNLLSNVSYCYAKENPCLTVSLLNSGYHRELLYQLDFGGRFKKSTQCDIVIVQTLHQGVYVRGDQLAEIKRHHLKNSYIPVHVDIEAPAEISSSFTLYLYTKSYDKAVIRLPIHFRYHYPSSLTSFANVPMYEPSIYTSCPGRNYEGEASQSYYFPCSNATQVIDYDQEELSGVSVCTWFDLKCKVFSRGVATVSVPLGNLNMNIVVVVITTATVWSACGYIIFAIARKTKN